MPERSLPRLTARFCGVTAEITTPTTADLEHLRYYLRDHLTGDAHPGIVAPDVRIRLETEDGGSFIAAIRTQITKRTWWRGASGRWVLYEEFQERASRPSIIPPFGIEPLRSRVRLRHGAAVAAPDGSGRALAVTGDSGTGKSIVALHLLRAGWRFISDDVLVIDRRTGTLHPYGRPIGVRRRSLPLLRRIDIGRDLLAEAPRISTRLGETYMVRPERLGRCARPDEQLSPAWRLALTRSATFRMRRTSGATFQVAWDPQRHLDELVEACEAFTAEIGIGERTGGFDGS